MFVCFECHVKNLPKRDGYLHTVSVADDAKEAGRIDDYKTLMKQAHAELLLTADDYFMHAYPHGFHDEWPNTPVWLPNWGASVGPCESCRKRRPCVHA